MQIGVVFHVEHFVSAYLYVRCYMGSEHQLPWFVGARVEKKHPVDRRRMKGRKRAGHPRSSIGNARNLLRNGFLVMDRNRQFRAVVSWIGIFMMILLLVSAASAEWNEKVLYSFQGIPDGSVPAGGVVFDRAGNLYGATRDGGSSSCASIYECGTVYQLAPPATKGAAWTETVLHVFKGNKYGDGASPGGGLVSDPAGNLYGTTEYGGTGNCILLGSKLGCGTVFELSPPKQKGGKWSEKVLYSFPTAKQGYVPWGDLVFDSAGNLYGATEFGGGYGGTTCDPFYQYCGAVFELSPPKTKGGKWTEKVLHGFKGVPAGAPAW